MPERDDHLSADLVGDYLNGQLDPCAMAALEIHVERCAACAGLLCEEAQLEEALYQVAELAETRPQRARFGTVFRSSIAAFASAAAMLLVLLPGQPEYDVSSDHADRSGTRADEGRVRARPSWDAEYLSCIPPSEGEDATCDQPGIEALLTSAQPLLASATTAGEELATWPEPGEMQRLCTPVDPRDDSLCRPVDLQ